jgi:hypothetical protein
MLQLTSCLFGTVVLHAYWKRDDAVHFLALCQTILSLLYYGGMHQVHFIDKAFAIAFFVQGTLKLALERNALVFIALTVAALYGVEQRCECDCTKTWVHAALHVVACAGLHVYLYQG